MSVSIKGFLEASFLDWPGKITAVIFLPGCNFRCCWCHNAALVTDSEHLAHVPLPVIMERIGEFSGWIDGICITGGEPTIHKDLPDFITLFKEKGLGVKLDTNGSNPQMLEALIQDRLIDCAAMDIKAPLDDARYARLTGVPVDLDQIRASIAVLRSSAIETIFRMTVVPDLLTEEDICQAARDIKPVRQLTLQQFKPDNTLDPSLRTLTPWSAEKLQLIQARVQDILGTVD
nr:anaerobic ribonucleoside-triphosphate reductase activating protein [Deltaproteobacteria bacterium]